MHKRWLAQLTPEDLSEEVEFVMEKHFVTSAGNPDKYKTTEPVGIPFSLSSRLRSWQLRESAEKAPGLHHSGHGYLTETVFLGWDKRDVEQAARAHAVL